MQKTSTGSRFREHAFYTGLAAIFVLATFAGFSRTYYIKGLFKTPTLTTLAHVHGALFSIWVLFFFGQALLVAINRTDLHRRAGTAGAFLALAIVVLGSVMTFVSVKAGYAAHRPNMDELFTHAFMDLFVFCILFGAGLYFRKRKEVHKRLMTLSMVAIILPALGRLPSAMSYIGGLILAFALVGLVYDLLFLRRIHLANVFGAAVILLTTPLRFVIAPMPAWHRFVEFLVK